MCGLPAVRLALAASSQRHNHRGAILALSTILSGDSLSSPLMPCVRPSSCWTLGFFGALLVLECAVAGVVDLVNIEHTR